MPVRATSHRLGTLGLALVIAVWPGEVPAHDGSAWGGLFRSRDAGATWLPVTPSSFVSGALAIAVSPVDPHHLLLATDTGLLRSRNGGRDWTLEARDVLVGAAFAVAFDVDGERALVAGASGIFRGAGDRWRPLQSPSGAGPTRSLVSSSTRRGRVYMAGRVGLHRSDDWGQSWVGISGGLPAAPATTLVVAHGLRDQVSVVADGRFWTSTDAGGSWQSRSGGLPTRDIEAVALDLSDANRLWSVAAGQVFRTDDQGQRWRPQGVPLSHQPVVTRAVAVVDHVILAATDRGLYRSTDDGGRWWLVGDNLPTHLDAGLLTGEPQSPMTIYAGFAVTSREEELRRAVEGGGGAMGRLDLVHVASGLAFLALVLVVAGVVIRHLARIHNRESRSVPR